MLERCFNVRDLRNAARHKLPRMLFDYIDGAADDEYTARRNTSGFNRYQLVPNVLRDVSHVDMKTKLLGTDVALPIILSPTGQTRLFHPEGENAVVRAANAFDMMYCLSSVSSVDIETIGATGSCPKLFQIYVWRDRVILKDFIQRCRDSGYHGLILTVDVQAAGNRERDLYNGLSIPPKPTWNSLLEVARHPGWLFRYLTAPPIPMANVTKYVGTQQRGSSLMEYINGQFDRTVTWNDAEWMVREWNGPFVLKGVLSAEDARRAVDIGMSAVMISNHGGRQLDHVPAPIDMLPEIVDVIGGKADIILDGGIRRGTDVLKALALGANACSIGRPYLYGLAAGGYQGVFRVLDLLRGELLRDMQLLGCSRVADIGAEHIRVAEQIMKSY